MKIKKGYSLFQSIGLLLLTLLLLGLGTSIFAQGYVQSVQGEWAINGERVESGTRLQKNTKIKKLSADGNELLKLSDMQGNIVKTCKFDCALPKNETSIIWNIIEIVINWPRKPEYSTSATKGDCDNFDGIVRAKIKPEGLTFDDETISALWNTKGEIRNERPWAIGINEIAVGNARSRVLILPSQIYRNEENDFKRLKAKVEYWKLNGVTTCSIKSFMTAYVDVIAARYKDDIRKYDETRKGHD